MLLSCISLAGLLKPIMILLFTLIVPISLPLPSITGRAFRKAGFSMTFDNCTITFGGSTSYYGDEESIVTTPSPIKLSSNVCKVENGTHLFASAFKYVTANAFYFTDAKGNKTLSFQALENGYIDGERLQKYTVRDYGKYIFFPDITFGGVLPGMTAEKFWDIIATESEDDDDDWDEDWDDEYYE